VDVANAIAAAFESVGQVLRRAGSAEVEIVEFTVVRDPCDDIVGIRG